jgi:hypothetical protein
MSLLNVTTCALDMEPVVLTMPATATETGEETTALRELANLELLSLIPLREILTTMVRLIYLLSV